MAKSILIVGAGPAGQRLAQALKKDAGNHNITMLSSTRFSEVAYLACYTTANADKYPFLMGPQDMEKNAEFQKAFSGVKIVFGEATSVDLDANRLTYRTASGESGQLNFDLLAVATGQDYGPVLSPRPLMSLSQRFNDVQLVTSTLEKAKTVVVIGGGPIAVKVAGDYKEKNPKAEVIMACRSKLCIKNWSGEEDLTLRGLLDQVGIVVREGLGDCKSMPKTVAECCTAGKLEITNGLTIQADLCVPGFMAAYNTSFLPQELLSSDKPTISTNEFGQSKVRQNIFAIGSLSSIEKDFMGVPHLRDGIPMYSKNIVSVLGGQRPTKDLTQRTTFRKHKAPFNMPVGHATKGLLATRHAPMGEGVIFHGCGFPCTLLCPCLWPCPFVCGYCCQAVPSGKGRGYGFVLISNGAKYHEPTAPSQLDMQP